MQSVSIKIKRWENPRTVNASQPFSRGDVIIVETAEGTESAIVEKVVEDDGKQAAENISAGLKIIRKANLNDLKIIGDHRKKEIEVVKTCRDEVKKAELPMKVVDASYSFDGGSITFAFIADGRVDFRDLVKNLSKQFQRSIRLHQIGARDESRQGGGYGICGRELCCVKFKGSLPSITSEMAKIQQIAHRGSERISGICGRLMCCLAFEADQYREILEEYPRHGQEVQIKDGKGVVKEVNALTGKIKIELNDKSIVIISKEDIK